MNASMNLMELNKNYNLNLSEDVSSRDRWDYNCMGFAIGTYEWEELDSFEYTYENWEEEESYAEVEERRNEVCYRCALELTLMHLRGNYPQMRIVDKDEAIEANEILIALRLAEEDFHFMRRFADGRWYEKCGASILRECTDTVEEDEWFSPSGGTCYNSKTIYLAVQNN